jgi:serine/threonine-protein kinase
MIGNVISSYKIIAKLGEGAMGMVYKGMDFMLDREVAIKVLRPELARYPDLVERFRAEAVTLARLQHANIATLYSFLRQGDDYFMVMEYVPGETLDALLRRSGALPSQQAVALFSQALEGIACAHRMGVIHRDIKPANVMLTPAGVVKVMDFGIARAINSTQKMTREGRLVGTVEYMSPEQIRGEALDARSDIYSSGVMLYEMLTGRVPFSSTSEFAIMQGHVSAPPLPPRELAPDIPPDVEQVLLRALAKAPEQRFQTAEDFRAALLGLAPAPDVTFTTQSLAPPVTLPMPPQGDDLSSAASVSVVPTAPIPGPPMRGIKETRMAAVDPPPQVVAPIPSGNPPRQPAAWPVRAENEESHLRLYWKHYAAGGATAVILVSIAAAMLGGLLRRPTPTPGSTVTPQPTAVMQQPTIDIRATPDLAPQIEPGKMVTPGAFADATAPDDQSNTEKATRANRRKSAAEAAARKEKARKAAEARRLLNQ